MTSTLIARLSMIILALVIGAASAGAYAYAGGATTPVADQAYTRRLPTPAPTATLVPAPVADDADLASADRRLKTDPFVRTELFFGSERPNKPEVSDAEFKQFLDEEVTPRFPDGLTVRLNSAAAQSDARCFPETGFCISGRIREYWEQNGGLPVFGFPTTPQRPEQVEASTFQVQHFERHRLELHPENARPYDVLLGRLGADQLQEMRVASLPQEQLSGCLYFEQTKHTACGSFARAWQSNGLEFDGRPGKSFEESLALFGMPLTNEMYVPLEDGKRHVVQYFERARFEQHPDNAPPYNVLFGLLDNEARAGTLLPRPQQLLPAPLFFNYKSQIVRLERDGLSPAAIVHEDDASEITSFSVSPNGYQLVYVLKSADGYRLIRTSAAGAHRTELYFSPGPISTPRWSPNGVQIAFHAGELDVSEPGATYQILQVSDANMVDRMLPDDNQSAPALAYLPEAWSPDRPRLLVSAVAKQSEGCTSMIFDLDGRLKALPAPEGQRWACGGAWLPDGRLLVSAVPDGSFFSKAGLWAIDLNTSRVAQFTPARDGDVNVLFGPLQTRADGTSSAFLLETVALPQLGDPRPFRYAAHMLTREGSPQRWLGNVAFELSEIAGWAPDGSGFLLRGSFGEPINRIKSVWVPLDGGAPYEINNAGYFLDWGR